MAKKPNFTACPEVFKLFVSEVPSGSVFELSPEDASLLVPHIPSHPNTLFVACSGGYDLYGQPGALEILGMQYAVEWTRWETAPKVEEPDCNTYRYVFGLTSDGRCIGYDASRSRSSKHNRPVADHHMDLDAMLKRYEERDIQDL